MVYVSICRCIVYQVSTRITLLLRDFSLIVRFSDVFRELHLHVDLKFLAWWKTSLACCNIISRTFTSSPPLTLAFCRLLTKTPHIRLLSISLSVDNLTPIDEAEWHYLSLSKSVCLPLGPSFLWGLKSLGPDARNIRWESLTDIRLEGFGDVAPLLSRCPNLAELKLHTWNGFEFRDAITFAKSLRLTPGLVALSLSPRAQWNWRILGYIGRTLPNLQRLNLQTRGFSHETRGVALRSLWVENDPYTVRFPLIFLLIKANCNLLCFNF
jgi:hypothetical protein